MSLIEEALRKQREETERTQPAPAAEPAAESAATPPPAPSAPPPAAEPVQRNWPLLVGIGVALMIVVLALLWMMIFGLKLFGIKPTPGATAAAAPRSAPAVPTQAVVAATAPAVPTAVTSATVAAAATPVVTTPAAPAATTTTAANVTEAEPVPPPAAAAASPEVPAAPPAAPAVSATPVAPATTAAPAAPSASPTNAVSAKAPVVWPRLAVSGVIGSTKAGRGTVLINNQMVAVGESIEGAKVLAVTKQGVTLTYSGETRTLSVGTATE